MIRTERLSRLVFVLTLAGSFLSALLVDDDVSSVYTIFVFFSAGFALLLIGRTFQRDRIPARWIALFQRPTSPVQHYARVLLLNVCIVTTLLAGMASPVVIVASFSDVSGRMLAALYVGPVLLSLSIVGVGFGISALVKNHDVECTLLLLGLSAMQVLVVDGLSLNAGWAGLLEALLFPIDGIFPIWQALSTGADLPSFYAIVHVVAYPISWILLGMWQLRKTVL